MKMLEAEIETRKLPVFISEADLRLRRRLQARLHVLRVHKLDALVVGRDAHPLFGGGEVVEAALGAAGGGYCRCASPCVRDRRAQGERHACEHRTS